MDHQKNAKYTIKASVFSDLFSDKKYLLQLYKTLHPEDTGMTEEDLTDVTIENVLMNGMYNDLGFKVGERLLILVEAQSTWTMNIIPRTLLYLAQTYQEYFECNGMNLYKSKKVKIPKPEIYVIFTGKRKKKPEYIYLSKEFFGGKECSLEIRAKVLYGGNVSDETGEQDIISQYVTFTKVCNEQFRLHGRTRKAVEEAIRICKAQNLLKEYLESREKEVVGMMMTLFDEETLLKNYVADKEREAAKRASKKASKKTAKEAAKKLLENGKLSVEEVADYFEELSVEDIRKLEVKVQKQT